MKNYNEINDEPSKEQLNLWDKRSSLCSMLDACYIIATDNHKKETMLKDRMNRLKKWVCECDTEEELNKMAFQIVDFVHEFILFRN
jgi:hypothetical protein